MREIRTIEVAGLNPRRSRIFTNSRLISSFFIALYRACFCRVLANGCEAKLLLCVLKFGIFQNLFGKSFKLLKQDELDLTPRLDSTYPLFVHVFGFSDSFQSETNQLKTAASMVRKLIFSKSIRAMKEFEIFQNFIAGIAWKNLLFSEPIQYLE